MKKFDYYQPETLKEAFSLMEKFKGRAKYVAGGTDLIVRIKQKVIQPGALISLRGIDALKSIRHNGGLSMGSMTLIRNMERDAVITRDYPALKQAVSVLANPQIRNVATVGGNFCNSAPCADCAPPLLVMEAILMIDGPGGTREVPVDDFFKGPGENCMDSVEILKAIKVPDIRNPKFKTGMAFLKTGRVAQDLAIASAAALVSMDGKICRECRLAAGSVGPIPLRLRRAEKLVKGEEITPELLEQVGKTVEQEVSPITDIRSTEEYRRLVTGVMIRRGIGQAIGMVNCEL